MTDHDQRFKTLLKELLPEFFELFFAEWAERFDFSSVEWLDKEVFPDPPEGSAAFSILSPSCERASRCRLRWTLPPMSGCR